MTMIVCIEGTEKASLHRHAVNITSEAKGHSMELMQSVTSKMMGYLIFLLVMTVGFSLILYFFCRKLDAHAYYQNKKMKIKALITGEDPLFFDFSEIL